MQDMVRSKQKVGVLALAEFQKGMVDTGFKFDYS